ncbi:MAG: hypothetical protein N4A47_04355 [Clostridia bacterium]|jgi:hypothetical protein|nr:hypothetical protein [Clostridia bacterium]
MKQNHQKSTKNKKLETIKELEKMFEREFKDDSSKQYKKCCLKLLNDMRGEVVKKDI